jgi:signal transduction histidine kinase
MLRKDKRETTALDLGDLVREILAIVRGELDDHGVVVAQHLAEPLPPIVGERTQLQQVVLNLVMNAVEAMKEVSDRRRAIDVTTRVIDGGDVLLTVADTGHGIKPDDTGRIFEPFFTTKPQGMGMGLSISRSIVEAHGGRLWASAGNPHGTIFHVRLPVAAKD